ncbi:MAG: hypothetical protein AAB849_00230, partial [Patescibacteria group bacterium]
MFQDWRNKRKKVWLSVFVMALSFNFVVIKTVRAVLPAPLPVTIIAEPVDEIKKGIGATITTALWSGLGYFIDKLTYETAVWLASGNLGQKPLWMTSGGAFFDTIADGAIGEMVYAIGDNNAFLKKYGISLCVPPDLKFQMWLQLEMAEQWQPATPHCSFKQIKNSWQQLNPYSDDYNPQRARQALSGIGVGFRPGQNDLSVLLGTNSAISEYSARQKEWAKDEADYSGKVVAPKDTSGQAKVPVSTIEKLFEEVPTGEDTKKAKIAQSQSTSDALAQGNISGVFTNVGRIFVNTLTNKLMTKMMNKGLLALSDLFGSDETTASPEAQVVGGRQAAEIAFAEFLKPNLPSVEQWNYTGELAADCSGNPSPYCGVMDNSLQTALAQAESGGAMTVKEALEKGAAAFFTKPYDP